MHEVNWQQEDWAEADCMIFTLPQLLPELDHFCVNWKLANPHKARLGSDIRSYRRHRRDIWLAFCENSYCFCHMHVRFSRCGLVSAWSRES